MSLELKPKTSLEDAEIMACEMCGGDYYHPVFVLVKKSAISTGLKKDKIFPLASYRCAQCGHINTDWDPLTDNKNMEDK